MSRILLIGCTPPPYLVGAKIEAAHYRTWQFVQPLLDDGHQVCLCADDLTSSSAQTTLSDQLPKNLVHHRLRFHRLGWRQQLQRIHDSFEPDCIVAINFTPCLYAACLHTRKPIWMDIYGDPLTIQQAARFRAGSDRGIPTTIGFVKQVLRAGDIFSACGEPQEHMLVGQLSLVGRLNSRTFGYKFVYSIPPGAPPTMNSTEQRDGRTFLGQFGIQNEDFVVLWCGGYNTWMDVKTLFNGLEVAMARNDRVHFASVGANTYDAPDNTYTQFAKLIENSRYRQRYHLLGWRPWQEVADFYRASDVGINIDGYHYETVYGTRTRIVEMMAHGLPVVTSLGCALSFQIAQKGAALAFPIGDGQALSSCLLELADNYPRRLEMKMAVKALAVGELSFATTTQPLREWAQNPQPAPDKSAQSIGKRLQSYEYTLRSVTRHILWRLIGVDR